jgi:hypothetical protein
MTPAVVTHQGYCDVVRRVLVAGAGWIRKRTQGRVGAAGNTGADVGSCLTVRGFV